MKVIFTSTNEMFRVVELEDNTFSLDDLIGDTYDPEVNPETSRDQLEKEFLEFQNKVETEGVFGYVLERWNPKPDHGWESVDSCFGFVGRFDRIKNDHYIVNELLETMHKELENA